MKKLKVTLFLLTFFGGFLVQAQEQQKAEPKIYVDDNGRLFVNKTLPFYLRLSTSPDPNAKSYLLKSESAPKYSNPFYFDTEGKNTIRTPSQVDPETRKPVVPQQDVIFEVYADGEAPISKVSLTGTETHYSNGKRYYGRGLVFKIETKDAVSGAEKIYYSINQAAYKEYSNAVELDEPGPITLKYYATDKVGNVEEAKSVEFILDTKAPEITHSFVGKQTNNVLGANTKIVLKAEDDYSGVQKIMYTINGVNPTQYRSPLPASLFSGGVHRLNVYAVDNVGNSTLDDDDALNEFSRLEQDREGPKVTIETQGDSYKGKYHYISDRTQISVKAEDKLKVNSRTYGINTTVLSPYDTPFSITDNTGLVTVRAQAVDELSNYSPVVSSMYYVDKKSPSTGVNYGNPQFFNRDTLFVNKTTKISLKSFDTESGVQKIEYAINDGALQSYVQPFNLNAEGFYTLKFKATDHVNNTETIKESHVFVDESAPEIYVNFSIESIRTENVEGKQLPVYPKYTKMYLSATDKYTGEESIYFSINGGKLIRYISAKNIDDLHLIAKEGNYKIKVLAKDKLGNENSREIEFVIAEK